MRKLDVNTQSRILVPIRSTTVAMVGNGVNSIGHHPFISFLLGEIESFGDKISLEDCHDTGAISYCMPFLSDAFLGFL